MRHLRNLAIAIGLALSATDAASFEKAVSPLVESSCIDCHDSGTETGLNLEALGHDLTDPATFRAWEKIFDRVHNGQMPPESEARPDPKHVSVALASLENELRSASLTKQASIGRVPARRLTKREFGYTLRDLLLIERDVTSGVPDEVAAGSFDTVGANQRIAAVHMESYLQAADRAIDLAIQLGRNPFQRHELDFINNQFLNDFHHKPLELGGSVSRRLDDGVALFRDVDYLITSYAGGFAVTSPGMYRIRSVVQAYQSSDTIAFKLIRKEPGGSASLLTAHDLVPGTSETIVVSSWLNPGDGFYSTFEMKVEPYGAIAAAGGSKNYKGPGIAIKSQQVEGPLSESWPPASTRQLLHGLELEPTDQSNSGPFTVQASGDILENVTSIINYLAPRIFRRPPVDGELAPFVELAKPAIKDGREPVDVLKIPLRSMLSSPQFLLFDAEAGPLDEYALANRLSYFLWKSMPDDELFRVAEDGRLSDPETLAGQVDRMLDDKKSERFVRDFVGQWLRLYQVNVTTPDEGLYPEYDELLGDAIPKETEHFFRALIDENLSVTNLVDSDFAFVNRRLAEHYGLTDVEGQEFRKVALPADSPRGGVLTQAAILKTTANGTVTSPVTRGNFVLTNFLGTPPAPPPPSVGSIEPDTRGKTTIREILAAHRDIESCATCHREIDPPGFALESFDPIGGFRTKYRATGGGLLGFFTQRSYHDGPGVDASGVTADGQAFSGVREFKQLLLKAKERIAENFVSQLLVYASGGEIEFADREEIATILDRTRPDNFPVKSIIHEVVQSRIFRNK